MSLRVCVPVSACLCASLLAAFADINVLLEGIATRRAAAGFGLWAKQDQGWGRRKQEQAWCRGKQEQGWSRGGEGLLYGLQWGLIRKLIQFRLVCVSCTLLVVALSTPISTPQPPCLTLLTHTHGHTHTQKNVAWFLCFLAEIGEMREMRETKSTRIKAKAKATLACPSLCLCVYVCVCVTVCTGAVDYVSRGRCAMEPEGYVLRITIHLQLQQEMNPEPRTQTEEGTGKREQATRELTCEAFSFI